MTSSYSYLYERLSHLSWNIHSLIDPRNFSCNAICNNCLFGLSSSTQNNLYSTAVYPSTQPSTQAIKNQTVKKTTNTNQQILSSTVPVSSWSVVPIAKAQKQKNVYTARLIHHRLYKKYCSSIKNNDSFLLVLYM